MVTPVLLTDAQPPVIAPSWSRLGWMVVTVLTIVAAAASFVAYRTTRPDMLRFAADNLLLQ